MMTSNYKNKSELYLDAADTLIQSQEGQFAVVPHTTYYSCLLYMEHICYVVKGKTEGDIRPLINDKRQNLHVAITNYIKKELGKSTKRNAYKDLNDFVAKITDLKKLRVKADYENEYISSDDSQKAFQLANDILGILKRN